MGQPRCVQAQETSPLVRAAADCRAPAHRGAVAPSAVRPFSARGQVKVTPGRVEPGVISATMLAMGRLSGCQPLRWASVIARLSLIHISEPTRLGMISYA